MGAPRERWPPAYDADDLRADIQRLVGREDLANGFYEWTSTTSTLAVDDVCQGEVVALETDIPVIGPDGEPAVIDHNGYRWLVVGNTCDFHRAYDEVRWTQFVPLKPLGAVDETTLSNCRSYTASRRFYIPPFEYPLAPFVADFTRPVAVDKASVGRSVVVKARLSRVAWMLLNACLVRFLARDDGRYDP